MTNIYLLKGFLEEYIDYSRELPRDEAVSLICDPLSIVMGEGPSLSVFLFVGGLYLYSSIFFIYVVYGSKI